MKNPYIGAKVVLITRKQPSDTFLHGFLENLAAGLYAQPVKGLTRNTEHTTFEQPFTKPSVLTVYTWQDLGLHLNVRDAHKRTAIISRPPPPQTTSPESSCSAKASPRYQPYAVPAGPSSSTQGSRRHTAVLRTQHDPVLTQSRHASEAALGAPQRRQHLGLQTRGWTWCVTQVLAFPSRRRCFWFITCDRTRCTTLGLATRLRRRCFRFIACDRMRCTTLGLATRLRRRCFRFSTRSRTFLWDLPSVYQCRLSRFKYRMPLRR